MTLSQLAQEIDGDLLGEDVMFSNVSTDTRSLEKGDLYLALVGENFDGNNFIADAQSKGACGALVSRAIDSSIPLLRVDDTHCALGKLSSIARRRSTAKVVALTGSQGKTTVKEMLGSILASAGPCLATEANLNNTIGVPLTLLKIEERHQYVVIEMGANSAGEIAFSVAATKPDIALITNASPAHIEGFGSLQGIVSAKGEIIDGLQLDGVVILNADDAHVHEWVARAGQRRTVKFSYSNAAGDSHYFVSAVEELSDGTSRFNLHTPQGETSLTLGFLGRHNILNAVAASAAAIEAGATLNNVAAGLGNLDPVAGRLSRVPGMNGCSLIDDSYNASPSSFFAAIDVMSGLGGQKILIMGDMKELGADTDSAHISVGEYASKAAIDEFWATGEKSRLAIDSYAGKGRHFESKEELITELKAISNPELTVLIKGSRGAKMNDVVNALRIDGENQC
ncbi:MAG: UDP-N-acetylmuramoyl-tripeptide--D-alanyl-D-alanine ligase [Pseudohongiellaceae bacterium]